MTLLELCYYKRDLILENSVSTLEKGQMKNYKKLYTESNRFKMLNLYQMLVNSIETNSSDGMKEYIGKLSALRFEPGYGLHEVQTAMNILEECMWENINKFVDEDLQISGIKQVTRLLGKAKEQLTDEYSLSKNN